MAISYPAIDTADYLRIWTSERWSVLDPARPERDGYVLFLSRLAAPKGVDDLIDRVRCEPQRATNSRW